jgi:hypothetical protein
MRPTLLTAVCLLSSAIAAPTTLIARDTTVIERAVYRVTMSTSRLDQALRSLPQGGSSQEAARYTTNLIGLGREIIEDMNVGAREIRRGPMMGPIENVKIVDPLQNMAKWLQSAMTGWVNAKTMVTVAGRKTNVHEHLLAIAEAVTQFGDGWYNKLPIANKAMGGLMKDRHQAIIEVAVREYTR